MCVFGAATLLLSFESVGAQRRVLLAPAPREYNCYTVKGARAREEEGGGAAAAPLKTDPEPQSPSVGVASPRIRKAACIRSVWERERDSVNRGPVC